MLRKPLLMALILVVLAIAGCIKREEPKKISLEERETIEVTDGRDNVKHIRIAVGGMITPKEGLAYYRHFLDYIGEKLGQKVEFVDRDDYAQINDMLRNGELEAAFVCSGPYVDGHKEFGLELLVAPQAYGKTVYYSYIIAAKDGPVKNFEDLRGKSFAFSDPLSNSGKLVPTYMLARMNETPETFFSRYIFTYKHDKSIQLVAQGLVDGAAVDSLIWEYLNRTDPEYTSKTRTVRKSAPYAIPPVVVPMGLDPLIKERLKQIFLNADKDDKGRELLEKMMIEKFVVLDDSAYDSVREMKSWLSQQKTMEQKKK